MENNITANSEINHGALNNFIVQLMQRIEQIDKQYILLMEKLDKLSGKSKAKSALVHTHS